MGTADPLEGHPKYESLAILGTGSFGTVIKARRKEDDKEVAIKLLKRGRDINKYVESELVAHSNFWHPHVVAFKEVFLTRQHLAVVLELVPGGNLFHFVRMRRGLSEKQARWFFQQLVMGIAYCHKMGVVNRDIKLENTLVANEGQYPQIKITDFGFCKHLDRSTCKSNVGTTAYMAPEVLSGDSRYDGKQADMWSCGVMLYVMLFCTYPFDRASDKECDHGGANVLQRILKADYQVPQQAQISPSCRDMLTRLLVVDPEQRITAEQIQQHPWFLQGLPSAALHMNQQCLAYNPHDAPGHQSVDEIRRIVKAATKIGSPRAAPAREADVVQIDPMPMPGDMDVGVGVKAAPMIIGSS